MRKLKCYYAHTMVSYGSTIEQMDIELLESLGFEVINPSSPDIAQGCKDYVFNNGASNVMSYFKDIIDTCELVAFRALPNGDILSGIAAEVEHAIVAGIQVIELPSSVRKRMMDYPATKQYLIELGHYKTIK